MLWLERLTAWRRLAGPTAALLCAALLAGCFTPLYGEHSFSNSPQVRQALDRVEVAQISAPPGTPLARLAVEMRNELTFRLTGGSSAAPPTHRLVIALNTSASSLIVDPSTARAEFEMVSLDANFQLIDIATSKPVMSSYATARVSYDIPGQQQRINALRGQRDAQSRAAVTVAQQIQARVASYFAGAGS
jgi:LPS-assembly lipoprotein